MLSVRVLSKSYGVTPLFADVTFNLNTGEKAGLIGPNGCSKTTLLRLIHGDESADGGKVTFSPPDLRVGFLRQGVEFDVSLSIAGYTQLASGDVDALSASLSTLSARVAEAPQDISVQHEYDATLTRLSAAVDAAGRAQPILASLGLGGLEPSFPVSALSGGQKTRLALAGLLLSPPDLLLLDEPTNHLDFDMLEWLEDWLIHSPCAALVVSHDRVFLDRTVTQILELDPASHALRSYPGDYSAYLEAKAGELARRQQEYADQQEEIQRLASAARHLRGIATFRKGGKADTGDKFARGFFANRGLATVKRAKSVEARVEKLLDEERIEKPRAGWQMKMEFGASNPGSRDVLALHDLTIGYGSSAVLSGIEQTLHFGERVALTGPNGSGKTTLLRTAAGLLPAQSGICRLGSSVRAGYMAQEQEDLDPALTVLDTLRRVSPLPETEARAFLHKYLFNADDVFQTLGQLSYGQRSRLSLACLVAQGCNFLLLDEPLNHLDIPSRARFEQALAAFEGSILTVVHDRYFIRRYATRIWEIKDGEIFDYENNQREVD